MNKDEIMKNIYNDPAQGYIGANALYHKVKKYGITQKQVNEFLKKQSTQQITTQVAPVYPPITASKVRDIYQVDLMFYPRLKVANGGYSVYLNCIDVYSRKAWSVPMTDKTAPQSAKAMEKILKDGKPRQLLVDKGKEFMGTFKRLMDKHNIEFIPILPENKNRLAIIERFNGTLREKIDKYRIAKNTNKFIDVLQSLVSSYNNTVHTTIKTTPNKIFNGQDKPKNLTQNRVRTKQATNILNKFSVGDNVRVIVESKYKQGQLMSSQFTKGTKKYSEKVYPIVKIEGYSIYVKGKPNRAYRL